MFTKHEHEKVSELRGQALYLKLILKHLQTKNVDAGGGGGGGGRGGGGRGGLGVLIMWGKDS